MKIALAQLNYHIGNFEDNYAKIKAAIEQAKAAKADLVAFAELAITGYPPRDFLEFSDFIRQCEETVKKIVRDSKGIGVIVGSPTKNPMIEGKDLHNSAYFIAEGKIQQVIHKTLLPTYDIFDEARYFEPATEFKIIKFRGKKIALTICEDLWNIYDNPLYTFCPMDKLIKLKPDLIINISASPFDYEHREERIKMLKHNAKKYRLPIFYVNHIGSQTELIFDGGSLVMDAKGNLADEMNYFKEEMRMYEVKGKIGGGKIITSHQTSSIKHHPSSIVRIHDALVLGIRDYFQKMSFKKAIIGLSGGIDSAIVAVLAVQALGKENVQVVLMPSEFSSEHSLMDAKELAENLDVQYDIISIQQVFEEYKRTLLPQFEHTPFNVAEENIQSRIRGNLLMALANKFGYILLNTSNKSELAVGYGTLYGDMAGGLSVLGDVYKTQIYELAKYINETEDGRWKTGDGRRKTEEKKISGLKIIPQNIIDKPPSAELRPNQKDTDSLPPYEILDKILLNYIEKRKGPKELVKMGFEKNLVERVLKLVNTNEYKRYQFPPILRVSPKAFGMGRRMPIAGKYLS